MDTENPFGIIVKCWLEKIKSALNHKNSRFGKDARTAIQYFDGPYDFLYGERYLGSDPSPIADNDFAGIRAPSFRMTFNKVAELVQIFGPVMYNRNPVRKVTPRESFMFPIDMFGNPSDPMVQQQFMAMMDQVRRERTIDECRSLLLESYQNYTPEALDLKTESRKAIDDALLSGIGLLWTEVYQPPGAQFKMIGSFYGPQDELVVDPDMRRMSEAKWVARRHTEPIWQVEFKFGLPAGTMKNNQRSVHSVAAQITDEEIYNNREPVSNDLVSYWCIWSKMGTGARLSGVDLSYRQTLDIFGDYCYIVICDGLDYPLNFPPQLYETLSPDQAFSYFQWPTPFWADDGWPFAELHFHDKPGETWPISHIKPGLGELKFLNWAYSFLAGKIRIACRDFLVMLKGAGDEMKNRILSGGDYELIEINNQFGTIDKIVQFLQHPPFHGDIWKVIQAVEYSLEKRWGLTELMYGQTDSQMRSASEAQVKSDQLRIRPDDMAKKVEEWMSQVGRREAIAARWHLDANDVMPILGSVGSQAWQQFMMTSDPSQIVHNLQYRVESGSAAKPNKERDADNMNKAMQTLMPMLQTFAFQTGQVDQLNALVGAWAKSIDLDAKKFLLPPPPPPPPPAPGPGPGPGQSGPNQARVA